MAVTQNGSVIKVTADNDTITGNFAVCAIRYMPGTSAQIKAENTSGVILWETASTSEVDSAASFRYNGTLHFDMAGANATLYIYTEID